MLGKGQAETDLIYREAKGVGDKKDKVLNGMQGIFGYIYLWDKNCNGKQEKLKEMREYFVGYKEMKV